MQTRSRVLVVLMMCGIILSLCCSSSKQLAKPQVAIDSDSEFYKLLNEIIGDCENDVFSPDGQIIEAPDFIREIIESDFGDIYDQEIDCHATKGNYLLYDKRTYPDSIRIYYYPIILPLPDNWKHYHLDLHPPFVTPKPAVTVIIKNKVKKMKLNCVDGWKDSPFKNKNVPIVVVNYKDGKFEFKQDPDKPRNLKNERLLREFWKTRRRMRIY